MLCLSRAARCLHDINRTVVFRPSHRVHTVCAPFLHRTMYYHIIFIRTIIGIGMVTTVLLLCLCSMTVQWQPLRAQITTTVLYCTAAPHSRRGKPRFAPAVGPWCEYWTPFAPSRPHNPPSSERRAPAFLWRSSPATTNPSEGDSVYCRRRTERYDAPSRVRTVTYGRRKC